MSLEIIVLVDGARGLTQTVDSLRPLPADGTTRVSILASAPKPQLAERLAGIVSDEPKWGVFSMGSHRRTEGMHEILRRSRASHVAMVVAGTRVVPAGLSRMADMAQRSGAPVVVGRHSGAALWGLSRDVVDLRKRGTAPVPLLVGSIDLARKRADATDGSLAAEEWLAAWHAGMLKQAHAVSAVVERPAVAGLRLPAPEWLHPLTSRARWDGAVLDLGVSCASAPATGQPGRATWRMLAVDMRTGDEVLLPSTVAAGEGWREVDARLDVTSLPEGVWRPAVEMVDPAAHGRGWLRVDELPDQVVHGRPVAATPGGDYLELQIGR